MRRLLRAIKRKFKDVSVLMLGLDNSGKTSILTSISDGDLNCIIPTQGFNFRSFSHEGLKFNLWDLGGHEMIRPYWSEHYQKAEAVIFVIDSADIRRLEEVNTELHRLLENPQLQAKPLLVLANKQDLVHSLPGDELSEILTLHDIRDRDWTIVPVSARTGEGMFEAFEWLVTILKA
jgi:small GTP-binding protein